MLPRHTIFFRIMKYIFLLFILLSISLLYCEVDNSLTNDDIAEISKHFSDIDSNSPILSYEEQISIINSVQSRVLDLAPNHDGIPLGQSRELKDVFIAKSGLCYDRSRVMEKVLRFKGFQTRHISVYSLRDYSLFSYISALTKPRINSHAVSEVLTKKGWLLLGSNNKWFPLEVNGDPISIEMIQKKSRTNQAITWAVVPQTSIYDSPFTYFYGLYSRHGYFYPPYNFIPDINYSEFVQNLYSAD